MLLKPLAIAVLLLSSPKCAAFVLSHTITHRKQSLDWSPSCARALSDDNDHTEIRPNHPSRIRHVGSAGDPYISPLLDSMSRRLRRLQRLNEQNDLFWDDNAGQDTGRATTSHRQAGVARMSKRSSLAPSLQADHQVNREDIDVQAGRIGDDKQLNSIHANAPAVLLQSGPGTGKSCVLAARIAYLIKSGQCQPDNLVILSFTNRDAAAIKQRALEIMYPNEQIHDMESKRQGDQPDAGLSQFATGARRKEINELGAKMWSGTIHAFSSGILRKYGGSVRIVAAKDIRVMVKASITRLIGSEDSRRTKLTIANDNKTQLLRYHFKEAMKDSNQNLNSVVANVVRCIELWKESGTLPPPMLFRIPVGATCDTKEETRRDAIRQDCVELAVRWGVPESVSILALDVYPDYQSAHVAGGTADPSDLATLARDFLLANPSALSALRTKLKHIVLDEYQDISVSQHALLRLVLRGHVGNEDRAPSRRKRSKNHALCFDVPRLFCAGDANQSLYGWRGAMPSLTVDRFLCDYPQGVVVPLGTNYRLPRSIMEAANHLVAAQDDKDAAEMTTFVISPAARTSTASSMLTNIQGLQKEIKPSKTQEVFLDKVLLLKSSNAITIQELWDAREEAKFVASSIRKHSKERISRCAKALAQLVDARVGSLAREEWSLFDPTDVAIVVRSSVQFKVIQEMLVKHNIPFIEPGSSPEHAQTDDLTPHSSPTQVKSSAMQMRPIKLITMHQCKGDEFDDVYLCGWSEGKFPHPLSVSSGTMEEERRLAYVALTRARQRAFITYQTNERVAHVGRLGERKHVTIQNRPSRFLYELMPREPAEHGENRGPQKNKGIQWNDDYGFKYAVAGKDLPPYFAKSYHVPEGFRPERGVNKKRMDIHTGSTVNAEVERGEGISAATMSTLGNNISSIDYAIREEAQLATLQECSGSLDEDTAKGGEHLLGLIQHALIEMTDLRIKGACKLYTTTFKDMLKDFGISRGVALVFVDKKRTDSTSIEELINASDEDITTKAISRCTAKELGHFLAYLILSVDKVEE